MLKVSPRSLGIAALLASGLALILHSCASRLSEVPGSAITSAANSRAAQQRYVFEDFGADPAEAAAVIDHMSHIQPELLPLLKQRISHAHSVPVLYQDAARLAANNGQAKPENWQSKSFCHSYYFETAPQGPELDLSAESFPSTVIRSSQLYALYAADLDVTIADLLSSAFVPYSELFNERDTSKRIPVSTYSFLAKADLVNIGSSDWLSMARRSILSSLKRELAEHQDAYRARLRSSEAVIPNGALTQFWTELGEDSEESIGQLVSVNQSLGPCNCGNSSKSPLLPVKHSSVEMCCFVRPAGSACPAPAWTTTCSTFPQRSQGQTSSHRL